AGGRFCGPSCCKRISRNRASERSFHRPRPSRLARAERLWSEPTSIRSRPADGGPAPCAVIGFGCVPRQGAENVEADATAGICVADADAVSVSRARIVFLL